MEEQERIDLIAETAHKLNEAISRPDIIHSVCTGCGRRGLLYRDNRRCVPDRMPKLAFGASDPTWAERRVAHCLRVQAKKADRARSKITTQPGINLPPITPAAVVSRPE